jgi:hydroxypyruvate isomerase
MHPAQPADGRRVEGRLRHRLPPGARREFRDGVAARIATRRRSACRDELHRRTVKPGEDRARCARRSSRTCARGARASRRELDLVIEPLNTHDAPGFFVPRAQGAWIIAEVGAANFGLQCDLYHTAMMGDDPAAILRELRRRDPPHPVRRRARARRARQRQRSTSRRCSRASTRRLRGWVSAEYRPSPDAETLSWFCADTRSTAAFLSERTGWPPAFTAGQTAPSLSS